MMFFGLVSQAKPEPDAALSLDYREQSRIQVLLRRAMRRLWQHRKLALMLATGLCLSTYTQAKVLDPLLKLWQPYQTTLASVASEPVSDNDRTTERPQSHDESDFKNTDNINDEPSLYA